MTTYRRTYSTTADLHDASAHIFRLHYLTMLDEAGVDPKILQYIAGHGNFSFTMDRHFHGRKKSAIQAGIKFENLLSQSDGVFPYEKHVKAFGPKSTFQRGIEESVTRRADAIFIG